MKKLICLLFISILAYGCEFLNDESEENDISEINIPDELAVFINVQIPGNTSKEEYILLDNKNRQLPLNNTENIKVEENTIVSLIRKDTNKTIYIAYILNDNTSSRIISNNSTSNIINGVCNNTNIVGVKSTARFILASVLNPISIFHVGNSDKDSFFEIFKSNVLCSTFSEEQILSLENAVNQLVEEGKDLSEIVVSTAVQTIFEPITGGLFSDCWEIGTELILNGQIELDAHPYQDYINSLILYNSNNPTIPYVIDEFTNVLPNGIIIKDVTSLDDGNWKIKFDAYNSLPIPLGVRVGKLQDGTTSVIEPANNETNFFVKSNGSSTIQIIQNGVTCEGFVNNAFDSYYTTVTGGLAIRSSDFDKREVELIFNPQNEYVLFQGPNENISVRIYHIMESLSHIFDIIQIGDKLAEVEEENIKIEILNNILSNSDVLNEINSNSTNLKVLQKVIGMQMMYYIEESIEDLVSNELTNKLEQYNIEKSAVSKNLKIIKTVLDVIDNINYLDAWSKIDDYTLTVKDYKLHIPDAVITTQISNITENSANSGGEVLDNGGSTITSKGVCWSTIPNPTIANNTTNDGSGMGVFSSNISGLSPETTYYVRAYASNANGTAYGNELQFTTQNSNGGSGSYPGETVFVQGGTFQMGSTLGAGNEQPIHTVTVSSFNIGKHEVTNAEYAIFLNEIQANSNGSVNGTQYIDLENIDCQIGYSNGQFSPNPNRDSYPVILITWFGAKAYAEHYGGRLPTEAEWEFAARGGNNSNGYVHSGSNILDNVGWYFENSNEDGSSNITFSRGTHPVGGKTPNELGISDMSGNVWEWCNDWYSSTYYSNSPQQNPQGPNSGNTRISRGGSWFTQQFLCRVANRWGLIPSNTDNLHGFRIVIP